MRFATGFRKFLPLFDRSTELSLEFMSRTDGILPQSVIVTVFDHKSALTLNV